MSSIPIEDYALIGDGHTAALVGKNGSIDWLCWPRFDSPACFAALLGTDEHGHWQITPTRQDGSRDRNGGVDTRTTRRYQDDTLVLETTFETDSGTVTLIDFMPMRNGWPELMRLVVGNTGSVDMSMDLVLRFDYGYAVPWVCRL